MVVPLEGTFGYVAVVPDLQSSTFSCPTESFRKSLTNPSRLVGTRPILEVSDAGLTPKPSPQNPFTYRSRISLIAQSKEAATVRKVSFLIDRGLISALHPGDELYLSRTGCGCTAVSAIREQKLIFAIGAITEIPLGCDFQARTPFDLSAERLKKVFENGIRSSSFPSIR